MLRRGATVALVLFVFATTAIGLLSYQLFNQARQDPIARADAIVVLGGEHDGREEYALGLAAQGYAPVVLMSDPYPASDSRMAAYCTSHHEGVEVVCRRPEPLTTRGEAILADEFARERGWSRIIVVSWQFHLPRVRFVFAQCYSGGVGSVIFRAVPRTYDYSPARWAYSYLYQYGGFVKAAAQGWCGQHADE